jgi:type I restriction enzyme S subunit
MANWQTVPMGELCSIQSGKSDTKDAVADGPYAFFDRSKSIKRSSRFLHDCEALIIPGEGAEFLPRHFVGKFDLHQRAYALFDFSSRVVVKFLYYYLHYVADYFPSVAVGATVKSLRMRHFEQLPVRLADSATQQRIVVSLDKAFEGIAIAKANAERNLQNARELFEGFHRTAFSRAREVSTIQRLGAIASFRNGINYTKQSKGRSVRIIGVRNFRDNFWVPMNDLASVTLDGELSAVDAVEEGDILSVRSNGNPELIGRCMLVGKFSGEVTHSGFTIRIRLLGRDALPVYVSQFLKSRDVRRRLVDGGTGSNIKSLNQSMLSVLAIPLPPVATQQCLVDEIDAMTEATSKLADMAIQKLAAINELKRSLLDHAFNDRLSDAK